MKIEAFYDERTHTLTYVVYDEKTRDAVVIDPVLDYEPVGSKVHHESLSKVIDFVRGTDLRLRMILETHAHADHLSGAQVLKQVFPGVPVVIGDQIVQVQKLFKDRFDLPESFPADGSQFDRLVSHDEAFEAGSLRFHAIHTPGHTPACMSYRIEDAVFTGDALFMPDYGTGRCDFPAGSAEDLYDSVLTRLYTLPEETRVFVGHDYQPGGREVRYESTIGDQKRNNVQLPVERSKADFVKFREERDAGLSAPRLLYQSIQVNIAGGDLPPAARNGVRFLKIPLAVEDPPT